MSDWDVVNEQPLDPWGVAQQINERPNRFQRNTPRLVQDAARGVADAFLAPVNIAGMLGWDSARRLGERADQWLDTNVATDASWLDEPGRAALQLGASVLMPMTAGARLVQRGLSLLPRRVRAPFTSTPGRQAATNFTGRALEATIIPGSAPYTLPNIALNFGVGAGLGVGIESLFAQAERDRTAREDAIRRNEAEQRMESIANRTWAEWAADNAPYGIAALMGIGAVGAGVRGARQAREAARRNADGATAPGTPEAYTSDFSIGTRAEAAVFNRHATVEAALDDAVRRGVVSRERANEIYARVSLRTAEAANIDIANNFMRTGYGPRGLQVNVPFAQIAERYAAMPAVKRRMFDDVISISDELDMRDAARLAGRFHGTSKTEPARTALHSDDYLTLKARRDMARVDPDVRKLEQDYRTLHNAMRQYLVAEGMITAREARDMAAMNPNYMHRMMQEMTMRRSDDSMTPIRSSKQVDDPLTMRERADGTGPDKLPNPLLAAEDYIKQVFEQTLRNQALRELADVANRGVLGVGKTMRDTPTARSVHKSKNKNYILMPYRDINGNRMLIEVDPLLNTAIAAYPRAHLGLLSDAKNLYQRMTTGAPAALAGYIQPLASAIMGTQSVAVNLPRQLATGYFDAWLKKHGINMRLIDPTFAAAVPVAFARSAFELSAAVLARSLHRSVIHDGTLAALLGPARAQRVADKAMHWYAQTATAQAQRAGLLSQGFAYGADARTGTGFADTLDAVSKISPRGGAAVPYQGFAQRVVDIRSPEQAREWATVKAAQLRGQPGFRHVHDAIVGIEKLADLIASAPMLAAFRLNRGKMADDVLASVIRQSIGDPLQYPGSRLGQQLTSASPYLNIALQTGHAFARAMRRDPVTTSIRVAQIGVLGGLTTLATAIAYDNWARENGLQPNALETVITMGGRDSASAFYGFIPGNQVTEAVRIPFEQTFAPLFALIRGGLIAALGLDDPEMWGDAGVHLREHILRLIAESNDRTMRSAFGIAGADVANNPLIDFALQSVFGLNAREMLSFGTGPELPRAQSAPGFETGRITRDAVPSIVAIALETILGAGGQGLLDLARTWGMTGRITDRTSEQIRATGQQYTLNMGASARIFGPALFGQERRVPQNDGIGEYLRQVERNLEAFRQNRAQATSAEPTIGNINTRRLSEAGREVVPEDTRRVIAAGHELYTNPSVRRLMEQRKVLRETVHEAQSTPSLRAQPMQLRRRVNELNMQIRDINNRLYSIIADVEQNLSQETGRRIRFGDLNPLRGLDQFPPL